MAPAHVRTRRPSKDAGKRQTQTPPADRTSAYAREVVAGRIVAGPYVRLACKRHLSDIEHQTKRGIRWRADEAERAISAIGLFKLENGSGFVLQPFQAFQVGSVFGWQNADGSRRFKNVYIEEGKGNGKTPTAAAVGLYALLFDGEPSPEVYSAATTQDQASISWKDAKRMVEADDELKALVEVLASTLVVDSTNGIFRAVSSEHRGLDGKRVFVAIIDELHEHPTSTVVDKMRAGLKARKNGFVFEITNSGDDLESVCFHHHEYSIKVLEGVVEDPSWFAYVCALDGPRTDVYQFDEAARKLVDSCSCGLLTATLIESIGREVFARAATTGISERQTPNTGNASTPPPQNGHDSIRSVTLNIAAPGLRLDRAIDSKKRRSSVSAALDLLLSDSTKWSRPRADAAQSADGRSGSSSTMITEPGSSEGSCASTAIAPLVCSEILRRLYEAHSPTCVARSARLEGPRLSLDIPGDDWRDEACWPKANPGLDTILPRSYLREQVREAMGMPSKEGIVKRLNFCVWTQQHTVWVPMDRYEKCPSVTPEPPGWVALAAGLDLSSKLDLTALSVVLKYPDPRPTRVIEIAEGQGDPAAEKKLKALSINFRVHVVPFFWIPEATMREAMKRDRVPYDVWQSQGFLRTTPGVVVDYDQIFADIVEEIGPRFSLKGGEIGYDPYNATQLASNLTNSGFKCVMVDQTVRNISEPAKLFEALIVDDPPRLSHDGNPVLRWCASNVAVKEDRKGNIFPFKPSARKRIDGVAATITALSRLSSALGSKDSVYKKRGLITL